MDTESAISSLNMDYENNKRFFSPANARKVKKIIISSIPFFAIAVVIFMIFGMGRGMYGPIGTVALALIVIGGGLMFYAMSQNVREKEVTQYFHQARKDFRTFACDKLGYPTDVENEAMLFMGAVTDKLPEGAFPARKLKDGRKLTQELQFTYLYIGKSGLSVFTRVLSLVEDKLIDSSVEIPFTDFDKAYIEPVGMGNKANLLKIANGKTVVFEAPLFENDYAQDEYLATVLHTRERALKANG